METVDIFLMIVLIAGPDVKLARKKSALYKKENENGKLRILEKGNKEKRKKKNNVIPKESAHYKNVHINILPLNCVLSLSPPLGRPPVGVEGGGPDGDPQARADTVIARDGDVNRTLRTPSKRNPLTLKSCSGMIDNTPSNLRLVVSPGGGSEGGDEEGQEPATQQTPGESPVPGQPGTWLGPTQAQIQTSAHSNHCDVVTVDSQVTRQVCQVTNYDKQQDKREHPERVCTKVESLMFIFTCETKFTTSSLSVNCDMR